MATASPPRTFIAPLWRLNTDEATFSADHEWFLSVPTDEWEAAGRPSGAEFTVTFPNGNG